jgi:hypothetical protein
MTLRTRRLALVAGVTFLQGCMAHEAAAPPAASPRAEAASPAPATPRSGDAAAYGVVHFPVSCTAEAQQVFDLAVSQQHSFYYP